MDPLRLLGRDPERERRALGLAARGLDRLAGLERDRPREVFAPAVDRVAIAPSTSARCHAGSLRVIWNARPAPAIAASISSGPGAVDDRDGRVVVRAPHLVRAPGPERSSADDGRELAQLAGLLQAPGLPRRLAPEPLLCDAHLTSPLPGR